MTDQRLRELMQMTNFASLPLAERLAILNELRAAYRERESRQGANQFAQAPVSRNENGASKLINLEAPKPKRKLPTAKMRASLARFDALPDDQQVGRLGELWGDA